MVLWCLFAGCTHPWVDAAGRLPGEGVLVARVLSGRRPELAALAADAPPGLRGLLERCWASDPAARPTAAAVALDTAGWLQVRLEKGTRDVEWPDTTTSPPSPPRPPPPGTQSYGGWKGRYGV